MKQLLTTLLLLFSITLFAQTTVVTGPKKKPQTTAPAKPKPATHTAKSRSKKKQKATAPAKPKRTQKPKEPKYYGYDGWY